MSTVRLKILSVFVLAGFGHFCHAKPALAQDLNDRSPSVSIRRGIGAAFDLGWGIGPIYYRDSIATIFERLHRGYRPQGLQLALKQLLGPIVLHGQMDFTWDTYGDPYVDSLGSLTRFSRSISLLSGTEIRFRRGVQVQPLVGMGWTYTKMVASAGTDPELLTARQTKLYSGFVAGGDILASVSSKAGIRVQYMHGFFDDPVNRLTMHFGGLWREDSEYEHMFAGIGIRAAWYAAHIREVIVMFDLGGSWPPD